MWIIELNGLFFMATCDTCPRCGFSARTSGLLREIGGRRSPERVNSLVKFPRCLAWFFMVGSQFPINIIKYSWFLTGDWEGLPRNIGNWPWKWTWINHETMKTYGYHQKMSMGDDLADLARPAGEFTLQQAKLRKYDEWNGNSARITLW